MEVYFGKRLEKSLRLYDQMPDSPAKFYSANKSFESSYYTIIRSRYNNSPQSHHWGGSNFGYSQDIAPYIQDIFFTACDLLAFGWQQKDPASLENFIKQPHEHLSTPHLRSFMLHRLALSALKGAKKVPVKNYLETPLWQTMQEQAEHLQIDLSPMAVAKAWARQINHLVRAQTPGPHPFSTSAALLPLHQKNQIESFELINSRQQHVKRHFRANRLDSFLFLELPFLLPLLRRYAKNPVAQAMTVRPQEQLLHDFYHNALQFHQWDWAHSALILGAPRHIHTRGIDTTPPGQLCATGAQTLDTLWHLRPRAYESNNYSHGLEFRSMMTADESAITGQSNLIFAYMFCELASKLKVPLDLPFMRVDVMAGTKNHTLSAAQWLLASGCLNKHNFEEFLTQTTQNEQPFMDAAPYTKDAHLFSLLERRTLEKTVSPTSDQPGAKVHGTLRV